MTKKTIKNIINSYDSDIRSMINFMQSNMYNKINILDDSVYNILLNINKNENIQVFNKNLNIIENRYKISKSLILKKYIEFMLNNKLDLLNSTIIGELEYIIHNLVNEDLCTNYIYYCLK